MPRRAVLPGGSLAILIWGLAALGTIRAAELIPPAGGVRADHPRLLLRRQPTPLAVSIQQLKSGPRDALYDTLLKQLKDRKTDAACQALVHLLTGDAQAAEAALARLRSWRMPEGGAKSDPFGVYFGCLEMALAYDWLHGYPGFTAQFRADLRARVFPLAQAGCRQGADHVFHNYVWMWNSGAMLWALATLGEDPQSDAMFQTLRGRFNEQLFPAMQYLDGEVGDAVGYWSFYCQQPALQVVLAAQSAFETDLVSKIRREQGNWLGRQLDNLVASVTPDMSFIHWGDIVLGPNGTVACEMAGDIDALTWALHSPAGAYLSRWLAKKRGPQRFYGETAIFYFLYSRRLEDEPAPVAPVEPPLAMLAGGAHGGHMLARSHWDDGATLVGFRATDFYGQHHHLDQGGLVICRNGPLAMDTGRYQHVAGAQMNTECHNTLLLGGQGQRPQRFQSAATLEGFTRRLRLGLETGDILFYRDTPEWVAVAGQFAQAYRAEQVKSCVRQLLFIRPGTVAIVDRLLAPEGKTLPEVQWLLHVPAEPVKPQLEEACLVASNGPSWLRCQAIVPGAVRPQIGEGPRSPGRWNTGGRPQIINTARLSYSYSGKEHLLLVHVLDVGDGPRPQQPLKVKAAQRGETVTLDVDGKSFVFAGSGEYSVSVGHAP